MERVKRLLLSLFLPEILDCEVFINADEIARELNPENVERVAFEAGRMMLERINERIRNGETFALKLRWQRAPTKKLSY